MNKNTIELFAGVGGFRIGLNNVKLGKDGKAIEDNNFNFIWSNQWEPSTKVQYAFDCYKKRFSKGLPSDEAEFSNTDIALVNKNDIPDFTLLTGGFPCQDYSVARGLSNEKGIEGKKGVLWWQINEILEIKKPPFVLLENVDRLLKSPSKQRGRDFGIMLKCFNDNNYTVEWRVINAADYGHPQKRRRTYIFAYKNTTNHYNDMINTTPEKILTFNGIFATEFPVKKELSIATTSFNDYIDLIEVSNKFSFNFENTGLMRNGIIYTANSIPNYINSIKLGDILQNDEIDVKYYLTDLQIKKFKYLKGAKKINRTTSTGHSYVYAEGSMSFPDSYDNPGRTMLTSEGTVNRSSHVVKDKKTNKYRFITPIEAERINQFPDNWTNTMPDRNRYFMMGNALVTGIIKKLGNSLSKYIENEQ